MKNTKLRLEQSQSKSHKTKYRQCCQTLLLKPPYAFVIRGVEIAQYKKYNEKY